MGSRSEVTLIEQNAYISNSEKCSSTTHGFLEKHNQ